MDEKGGKTKKWSLITGLARVWRNTSQTLKCFWFCSISFEPLCTAIHFRWTLAGGTKRETLRGKQNKTNKSTKKMARTGELVGREQRPLALMITYHKQAEVIKEKKAVKH